MTVASNLRNLVSELRPIVDQRIDIDVIISDMGEGAREKGLDFSQVKSLVFAMARDDRDGGERVKKIIKKSDNAAEYISLLKREIVADTAKNPPQSNPNPSPFTPKSDGDGEVACATPRCLTQATSTISTDPHNHIPQFLARA